MGAGVRKGIRARGFHMQSPFLEAPRLTLPEQAEEEGLSLKLNKENFCPWKKWQEAEKFFGTTYDFKHLFSVNQTQLPPVQSGNKGVSTQEQPGQADNPQVLVALKVAMLEAPPFWTSCSS